MPLLVIHLPDEHRAAPDLHWIRLSQVTHGWELTTSLPVEVLHFGPTKCGFAPDRVEVETKAIMNAISHGVGCLFVEG